LYVRHARKPPIEKGVAISRTGRVRLMGTQAAMPGSHGRYAGTGAREGFHGKNEVRWGAELRILGGGGRVCAAMSLHSGRSGRKVWSCLSNLRNAHCPVHERCHVRWAGRVRGALNATCAACVRVQSIILQPR